MVRKSSSTRPAARNGPIACGPPSERISRCPRSRSAATAAGGSTASGRARRSPRLPGSLPASRAAPASVVSTIAPACERRVRGVDALRSPEMTDDLGLRRPPEPTAAARRTRPPRRRVTPARPSRPTAARRPSFPTPITSTSAQARSSPSTNRSAALSPATILFDDGSDGIATTPSSVETKFANRRGSSNPSDPP